MATTAKATVLAWIVVSLSALCVGSYAGGYVHGYSQGARDGVPVVSPISRQDSDPIDNWLETDEPD